MQARGVRSYAIPEPATNKGTASDTPVSEGTLDPGTLEHDLMSLRALSDLRMAAASARVSDRRAWGQSRA
jgi:hypothetical protein